MRTRDLIALFSVLALTSSARAHTPYVSFAAELSFAPGAIALEAHERERLHALVRKLYGYLRADLPCPELVGVVIARGEKPALLDLQRKRLAYVKNLLAVLGLSRSAMHDEVVLNGAGYMPESANVIQLDGKLNVAWSQDQFDKSKTCSEAFRR